jgi:hypothetical protein
MHVVDLHINTNVLAGDMWKEDVIMSKRWRQSCRGEDYRDVVRETDLVEQEEEEEVAQNI